MTEFVAIDFETANADLASICQIGAAVFRGSQLVDTWRTYVDPDAHFDPINVSIHGIDESTVRGAAKFPQIFAQLCSYVCGRVSVCHTSFDRVAFAQAMGKYRLQLVPTTWLDTARVARRAWPQFSRSGYGLANLCQFLRYEYSAHDALEDAKAAGQVLLAAMRDTSLGLTEWLTRIQRPIDLEHAKRAGNPHGRLYGEVVVFTGALGIPRSEAATLAAQVGCEVTDGVTKHTTILVVGDQDVARLAGHDKSAKHRKAEALIAEGHNIRIIRETDFKALVGLAN